MCVILASVHGVDQRGCLLHQTPIHYADLVSVLVLCSVSHVCSSDSPPWSTWYMQVPWAFREGRPDSQEELQGILKAEEESVPHPLYPCRFHVPGRRENA